MKGKFIVIEGNECSGKTTLCHSLVNRLIENGILAIYEKEPTDGWIGKLIREKYLSGIEYPNTDVMSHLFVADRYEHLCHPVKGVLAKLENGINVICDRFYLSQIACQSRQYRENDAVYWQTMVRQINMNNCIRDLLKPDMSILIRLSPEKSYERSIQRGNQSIFENSLEVLQNIYYAYDDAVEQVKLMWKEEYIEIDGDASLDIVQERLWNMVYPILKK